MGQLKSKIRTWQQALVDATSYQEWYEAASTLDQLENRDAWRYRKSSSDYNYELIDERLNKLRLYRRTHNLPQLVRSLHEGLHHNLGNMGNPELYNYTHVGTKQLIENYVNEVCDALDYLCDHDVEFLSYTEKLRFFQATSHSYGRPALMLSGGVALGFFHVGVVKALWEQGLLPRVISGSSAGAIVAAALGSHVDEELAEVLDPSSNPMKMLRPLKLMQQLRQGCVLDSRQLERFIRHYTGEYTFEEAFRRTGRSINISVSPTEAHQMPRLMSEITSPYVQIWSAVLASCSVPGAFPPVMLMSKNHYGQQEPYMPTLRWIDGSIRSDLPKERLTHLCDVNYFIVSQTNPHVVPFLHDRKHHQRDLLAMPKRLLKAEVAFHGAGVLNYMRHRIRSPFLRQFVDHAHHMLIQNYEGDVTIFPHYRFGQYLRAFNNPTSEDLKHLILAGERATWPKISMIRTHTKINQTLESCIHRLLLRRDRRYSDDEFDEPEANSNVTPFKAKSNLRSV